MTDTGLIEMTRRYPGVNLILLTAFVTLSLLAVVRTPSGQAAQFDGDDFEANIDVSFEPTNPREYQGVNVTIGSKYGVPIIQADLWIEVNSREYTSSGAYSMKKIDSTHRYAELNGYAARTNVTFYITAYDGLNKLRSDNYYYDVVAKRSWKYPAFEKNVALEFGPDPPGEGESVNLTVESKDLNVKMARADINVTVELPEVARELSGAESMDKADDFTYNGVIPPYPGNATVTFRITAYDELWNPTVSKLYSYTVVPPEEQFVHGIYVVVFNNITHRYMEANVTVYNDAGYRFKGETVNGIFWTPTDMPPDEYVIQVDPKDEEKGKIKTKTIRLTKTPDSLRYDIFYGEEDISTKMEVSEFPDTRTFTAFILVGLLTPLAVVVYRKQRRSGRDVRKGRSGKESASKVRSPVLEYLERLKDDPATKKKVGMGFAFALLGFLASSWCPFYPWWMMMIFTLVVGGVGYRFPYMALLIVSFISMASSGFQTPQFGLMFMIFALIVCICSLFSWKFGYFTFLMVFLSTFGLSFAAPIITVLLFSLFLSVTSTVVAGVFITVMSATGNVNNLSFLVSDYALQKESIVTFSRAADYGVFSPQRYLDALAGIRHIDLEIMGTFVKNYLTTMVPLVQLLFWILLVVAIYMIKRRFSEKKGEARSLTIGIVAYVTVISVAVAGMLFAGFEAEVIFGPPNVIIYLLTFPVIMSAVLYGKIIRRWFPELYQARTQTTIGTRIGATLRLRETGFHRVGGLASVKSEIKDSIVGPLLEPEMSKEYGVEPPKGMILFGPPGCGKTLLMRVIATELDVEMIGVKCSDIMSKWYGESENLISALFENARERKPCVLFLDEIDAIAKRRDFYSADDVTPRLLSIMLGEMDGMDKFEEIIIIAATNRPELIDPALLRPGRFDKVIYVPPPKARARWEILKIHLKGKPVSKNVDPVRIAKMTNGYSGADLANLCKECALRNMKRALKTERRTRITMRDFVVMTEVLKPSVTPEMIEEYEELQVNFERKIKKIRSRKGESVKKRKRQVTGRRVEREGPEDVPRGGWVEEDDDELYGSESERMEDDELYGSESGRMEDDELYGSESERMEDDDLYGSEDEWIEDERGPYGAEEEGWITDEEGHYRSDGR